MFLRTYSKIGSFKRLGSFVKLRTAKFGLSVGVIALNQGLFPVFGVLSNVRKTTHPKRNQSLTGYVFFDPAT